MSLTPFPIAVSYSYWTCSLLFTVQYFTDLSGNMQGSTHITEIVVAVVVFVIIATIVVVAIIAIMFLKKRKQRPSDSQMSAELEEMDSKVYTHFTLICH